MAKRRQRRDAIDLNGEVLEVWGFDLLAHVEAMLRHVRQYQREAQRARGLMGKGQTDTADRNPLDAIRQHIKELRKTSGAFGQTLDEIVSSFERATARSSRKEDEAPPSAAS